MIRPEEQKNAKQLFIDLIDNHIANTPAEQKEIIILSEKLAIDCHKNDCGYSFMDSICEEYKKNGWHIKYYLYMSFIWRHKIIISKEPIEGYDVEFCRKTNQPIKIKNEGFKCTFHKSLDQLSSFIREATSFMSQHKC